MERPPNLSGGWVAERGTVHFNFVHRFWISETGGDDKLVNTPSMLLAAPLPERGPFGTRLPPRVLVGVQYATNSLVAPQTFNEWELFARWAPFPAGERPFDVAVTAAYNSAAESADGELSVAVPLGAAPGLGPVRVVAAARGFSDALGLGEAGWAAAGGVVVRPREHLALAADVGTLQRDGDWAGEGRVWGAGLQLRIPATPHTLSIQATNTRTGTMQGASGSAVRRRTVWGFEFTIPMVLARYIPALRDGRAEAPPPPEPGADTVRVTMTDDMRFVPDTIRIRAGQTVVWDNPTDVVHTVTAHPERVRDPQQISLPEGAEPFDSGNMFPGDVFQHTFTVVGEYVYVCVPHDMLGMFGTVIVEPE
jgi:plastocyanin